MYVFVLCLVNSNTVIIEWVGFVFCILFWGCFCWFCFECFWWAYSLISFSVWKNIR